MKLKQIAYSLLALGSLAVGTVAGRYSALDREYRIERPDEAIVLRSKSLDKAYVLTKIGDQIYLGTSDHNLKGVQVMGKYEGQQSMKDTIDGLQTEVDSLETKMAARRLTDKVEDLVDDVKDGWRNFKHNLIDE